MSGGGGGGGKGVGVQVCKGARWCKRDGMQIICNNPGGIFILFSIKIQWSLIFFPE